MQKKQRPNLAAMDLEGCLVPEIWISLSQKTGIPDLGLTTRDIKSYTRLMQKRLAILKEHSIGLLDLQEIIMTMEPLPGARDFLDWLRPQAPLIILSDTFYEFAGPLLKKLGDPVLFCHTLHVEKGEIKGWHLRSADSKAKAVRAFQKSGFCVSAAGDSYNDISMLKAADKGILFKAPDRIASEFPQFSFCNDYVSLKKELEPTLHRPAAGHF